MDHNVSGSDSVAIFSGEMLTNNWNNCFYNNGLNYNANVTCHNDVLANPQLTDPANGEFTLLYNSPCIDAGADTLVYNQTNNHDMGWVVDIGANEYTGTRVLKSIIGTGDYYFGGQVRAKINVTTLGSLSEIDLTVHPGETHTNASASLQRWYEITSTGSGATFDITLSYKDTELNGEVESDLNLWRWDGASWNGPGLSSDTSTINNWLTVTGQTSFGDWVISDADDPGALPVEDNNNILYSYQLQQNYPNPFNPSTRIQYHVPSISQVTLKVYDVLGNEVATLVNEEKPAGSYEVEFNPASAIRNLPAGRQSLASGIYFCRLQTENYSKTIKMLYLK